VGSGLTHRARVAAAAAVAAAMGCLSTPDDGGDDPPVQLLANPSFEEGLAGWTFDGAVEIGTTDELSLPASGAGNHVALLGRDDNQDDRMKQSVVVPDSAHSLVLTGVRCYSTSEGNERAFDTVAVYLESTEGTTLEKLLDDSNLDAVRDTACEWLPFQVATEDHAGEHIRLVIEALTDSGVSTSFAFDDLALTGTP
jgi:hypothetical protein